MSESAVKRSESEKWAVSESAGKRSESESKSESGTGKRISGAVSESAGLPECRFCEDLPKWTDKHLPARWAEEIKDMKGVADEFFEFGNVIMQPFKPGKQKVSPQNRNVNIVKRNITYSLDQLFMQKDNIAHFMSTDCVVATTLAKSLQELKYQNFEAIKKQKPTMDSVTAIQRENGTYILNIFIKEQHNDRLLNRDVENAIKTLGEAMVDLKLTSVRISKSGDLLSDARWLVVEQELRKVALEKKFNITICTGEVSIPKEGQLLDILTEAHDSATGGHGGVGRTYHRIRQKYFWPNMKADITDYVLNCEECQKRKICRNKTREPMKITTTPNTAFELVEYDIVGPFLVSNKGHKYILTMMCNLTKYGLAIPLENMTAESVATTVAEKFICIYGSPLALKSDQGSNFMSKVMEKFAKLFKIQQYNSTSFRPETQGSLERSHAALVAYLRAFKDKTNWCSWLPFALFSYNTAVHSAHNFTPFELIFGHKANIPSEFEVGTVKKTYNNILDDLASRLQDTQSLAQDRLFESKEKSKVWYDKKCNPVNFLLGDKVFLLKEPRKGKFDDYYTGPHEILELHEDLNAVIDLGNGKTKKVHLNKLKRAFHRLD